MAALSAPPAPTVPIGAPPVRIRPLEPPDGWVLDAVHAGLSDASRYSRYHGPKPRFASAERTYLTATDGRDHIALVALTPGGEPLGIARSVRLRDDPSAAEIAAEVVDSHQNRGIGMDLIARLARRATTLGIERFSATVLSESRLKGGLVRRGWRVTGFDGPATAMHADVWALLRAA